MGRHTGGPFLSCGLPLLADWFDPVFPDHPVKRDNAVGGELWREGNGITQSSNEGESPSVLFFGGCGGFLSNVRFDFSFQ